MQEVYYFSAQKHPMLGLWGFSQTITAIFGIYQTVFADKRCNWLCIYYTF